MTEGASVLIVFLTIQKIGVLRLKGAKSLQKAIEVMANKSHQAYKENSSLCIAAQHATHCQAAAPVTRSKGAMHHDIVAKAT